MNKDAREEPGSLGNVVGVSERGAAKPLKWDTFPWGCPGVLPR